MRAVVVRSHGAPEVLEVEDLPTPHPGPGQVRIATGASLTVLVTAYNVLLRRGRVEEGDTVLVHGATGSVGGAAVQLAGAMGAQQVIATVGGPDKLAAARALGATHVIDHRAEDFAGAVRALTGDGADVIVDPIGGEVTERGVTCLAPFGRLVICGTRPGRPR